MAKRKRERWEVTPSRIGFGWEVTRNGATIQWTIRKKSAIALAVELCVCAMDEGRLAELVIKGRDGKIDDSRTYGNDPRSIKG